MNASHFLGLLRRRVPEFTADDLFLDLPHVIAGEFAEFVLGRVRRYGITDPVVKRSFQLVNDLFSEGDPDAINIIETSLFEQLADDRVLSETAKALLETSGRKSLEQIATWAGRSDITPC